MDAKTRYKAKKIKIVFFDIDDTLRNVETGYVPARSPECFLNYEKKEFTQLLLVEEGFLECQKKSKALQPDFYVTLNGSYVIDRKEKVIYEERVPNPLVQDFIAWAKQVGIHYGLVGSHDAKLSTRTDMISEAINPIYPDLDVDPDFHEKKISIKCGLLKIKEMTCTCLTVSLINFAWFVGINIRLILCRFRGSKAMGVEKVVEHLGLKPDNVMVLEMG